MKSVVLYGPGQVDIGDLPKVELKPGEVRVKVAYCGICGSDFHKYAGKKNTHAIHYPVALGHEISGVIAEIGSAVTEFHVGDRVTVDPNWSCGKCDYCKEGLPSFCKHARGVVKGMTEYVVSPEESVYRLPDQLSLRDAALAEPLACCLRGMDLLGIRQGESVALVGFGAIGAIMLQLIRSAGAGEILVVEANAAKKELAMELGATAFIDAKDEDALKNYASTHRIAKVMECVGVGAAQATALEIAGKGATVVLFGVSDSDATFSLSLYRAFLKELTIKTSFVNPHTTARAVKLLASGILRTDKIIYTDITMEEAVAEIRAPSLSRNGKVLVAVDPSLEA